MTEEGKLLQGVQSDAVVDYDIDTYASRLGTILDRKTYLIAKLKDKLSSFRAQLQQEEDSQEKASFDLKLIGFDAKSKIKVIKEIRSITGLGLKESKELVEKAPSVIKKDIKKEEAEELKSKLEEIGGTLEIS